MSTSEPLPAVDGTPAAVPLPSQLRLVVVGSVDDGKSTLVGRLLHDTKNILADTYDAMVAASTARGADQVDLALLTDGLRAEREQGITIDVAYRYFATPRRTFVLADTPGHVQYTRNMVSGASTADAAVMLVDVRHGVSVQTRRHAALLALLRVPHVVVAVNKMDAVGYSKSRFDEVASAVTELAHSVGLRNVRVLPVSALTGEGVARPGPVWSDAPTLLAVLEELPVEAEAEPDEFRMPVQLVIRPRTARHPDHRAFAGRITSGEVRIGDRVRASPSGGVSRVVAIDTPNGEAESAGAGESVSLRLADELDVARGEILAPLEQAPSSTAHLRGAVAWMSPDASVPRQRVLVKLATKVVRGLIADVSHHWDVETSTWRPDSSPLPFNAIGQMEIDLAEPVAFDDYARHRRTGAFLVIDPASGATLAGGMVGAALGKVDDDADGQSDEDWLAG